APALRPLIPTSMALARSRKVCLCAGFWTPATMKDPRAQLAGVQKAPRHEVAGRWAPAKQRALRGFNAGAELHGFWERDLSASLLLATHCCEKRLRKPCDGH